MIQPIKPVREEKAIILDFLPHGYPFDQEVMKIPVAQALGTSHLTILELIPKKDIHLQPNQEVYIGEGKREEIHHIKGRVSVDRLTATAKNSLQHVVEEIVSAQEKKFVDFFNKAQPLSMRMHQLELLPGLGKKHMWEIIEARKGQPFTSFEDLKNRVKLLPNPKQVIVKRILAELADKEKYRIFTS